MSTSSIYPVDFSQPTESFKKPNIPYTYLIGWSTLNIWYYGCQHGKKAHPNNLWTTYFTSSARVKKFRKEHGEPDVVEIRQKFKEGEGEKTRTWEYMVIKKMKLVHSDKWLNIGNQGKEFCCKEHSLNTKKKISDSRKGTTCWNDGTSNYYLQPGEIPNSNWIKGRKPFTLEHCKNMSKSLKGRIAPNKGKPSSIETKKKLSEIHKEKSGTKGKTCWNDGTNHFYLQPGEIPNSNWIKGRTPQFCQKISKIQIGRPSPRKGAKCTPEQCKRNGDARRGKSLSEEHKNNIRKGSIGKIRGPYRKTPYSKISELELLKKYLVLKLTEI